MSRLRKQQLGPFITAWQGKGVGVGVQRFPCSPLTWQKGSRASALRFWQTDLERVWRKKLKLPFFFPASERCKHMYCHRLPFLAIPSCGNDYLKPLPPCSKGSIFIMNICIFCLVLMLFEKLLQVAHSYRSDLAQIARQKRITLNQLRDQIISDSDVKIESVEYSPLIWVNISRKIVAICNSSVP